jgi:uncharacterized protein (TIGR02996 family)
VADVIEQLFAAIDKNPDDASAYVVLADALLEANDPRGELIEVQRAITTRPKGERAKLLERERLLVASLRKRMLGPLAVLPSIELEVKQGFAHCLRFKNQPTKKIVDGIESVAKSPDARLLRSIEIHSDVETESEMQDVLDGLEARDVTIPRSLRRLRLGSAFDVHTNDRMSETDDVDGDEGLEDDLTGVLRVFPFLEELEVDLGAMNIAWAPLESAVLKRFTWIAPFVRAEEVAPLTRSKVPALEAFTIWTGAHFMRDEYVSEDGDDDEVDMEHGPLRLEYRLEMSSVSALLAMLDKQAPKLRELGLPHYTGGLGKLAALLAKHAVTKRIETLDLGYRAFDDEDADVILDLLRIAPNIKRLGIDGATSSSSFQRQLAKKLAFEGEWGDSPPRYRVISAGE